VLQSSSNKRERACTRVRKKRSNASAKLSESRAGCCAGYCIAEVRAPHARQGGLTRGERRGRCAHGKPAFQTLPLPLPRPLRLCVVLGSALAGLWARKDRAEGELGGVLRRACSFKLLLARPIPSPSLPEPQRDALRLPFDQSLQGGRGGGGRRRSNHPQEDLTPAAPLRCASSSRAAPRQGWRAVRTPLCPVPSSSELGPGQFERHREVPPGTHARRLSFCGTPSALPLPLPKPGAARASRTAI
jgi:hypothetical protein